MLRLLGNILWHVPFLGFLNALYAFLLGLVFTALLVTAPLGLGLLQYSKFLLLPFSYDMVDEGDLEARRNPLWVAWSFVIMLLYLPFGFLAFICGLFQCLGLALTLVGIPAAIVVARSLPTYFNPVGKVCVPLRTF